MGWKGKVSGKLGSLLSHSVEVPLKQLYNLAARPSTASKVTPKCTSSSKGTDNFSMVGNLLCKAWKDISHDGEERLQANVVEVSELEKEDGPDTSSLTAFLLSLLSNSETSQGGPVRCNLSTLEEETSKSAVGSCSANASISLNQRQQVGDILSKEFYEEAVQSIGPDGMDRCDMAPDETNENTGLMMRKNGEVENQSFMAQLHGTPSLVVELPGMLENSSLLSDSLRAFIYSALPTLVKGRSWVLCYSTARDGTSLHTLYRSSAGTPGPFLLVVRDFKGVVFGGFVTVPLKPMVKGKYQGTSEMFVFTNVHGKPRLFRATGTNRYYFLCLNDSIAFGGGGHFALHLDEDLLKGSSGACTTFDNYCLATTEDFSVANVELWAFAHTSKFA